MNFFVMKYPVYLNKDTIIITNIQSNFNRYFFKIKNSKKLVFNYRI